MRLFFVIFSILSIFLNKQLEAKELPPLFVYKGAGCGGREAVPKFEAYLGRKVDGVIDFVSNKDWKDMVSSTNWLASCWKDSGYELALAIPMLPLDKSATMELGASGDYDGWFRVVAENLVNHHFGSAYIRIGWEFNGNWYRWGSQSSLIFRKYFEHIVTSMRTVPGQSFRFVWNPNIGLGMSLGDYYPGDDFVDIIGIDLYNQSWSPKDKDFKIRWNNFLNEPYGLNWLAQFARQKRKPLALPEWGTGTRPDGHGFGDDPDFIRNVSEWINANDIAFDGYWDYPAPDYNGRLSDGSKPNAAAMFKQIFSARQQ